MEKRYRIVMLAINKDENIVMAYDMKKELAEMTLEYFKNNDSIHYYEMQEQ